MATGTAGRPTERGGQRGMVTIEVALASIGLAALVGGGVLVTGAVLRAAQCQVAATEIARQQARGDAEAVARARADAPAGAHVTIATAGGVTRVSVEFQADVGPLRWPIEAHAQVIDEAGR